MTHNMEPPFVYISCYSELPADDVFRTACSLVQDNGAVLHPDVISLPRDVDFQYLFHVHDSVHVSESLTEAAALIAGSDPNRYAVEATYVHPHRKVIQVERSARYGDGRHPVALLLGADILGIPEDLWHGKDRKKAVRIGRWLADVLRGLTLQTDALYGCVTVEKTMPTPEELVAGATVDADLFVNSRLLAADSDLGRQVAEVVGPTGVHRWEHGVFYASWTPFTRSGRSAAYDPDADETVSRALASALRRYYREAGIPLDPRRAAEQLMKARGEL